MNPDFALEKMAEILAIRDFVLFTCCSAFIANIMHIFFSMLANISNNKIANILNKYLENDEQFDILM